MKGTAKAENLQVFHGDFEKLKKNRAALPLRELVSRCGKAYQTLVGQVIAGADWYADAYMNSHAHVFPRHPQDTAGNKWLDRRIAAILLEERMSGGLVERYQAALIDQLDMQEYRRLVWELYSRIRREAYIPYWARHCRQMDSGRVWNDILRKFWLASESGKSGGWINSDYSGWDGRFPPQI